MSDAGGRASESLETAILSTVRELAREVGGPRAAQAVTPSASLERDVGLGSLERVELLSRLERILERPLGEHFLVEDSVSEILLALGRESTPTPESRTETASVSAATPPPPTATTLHEALFARAQRDPDRPAVFLREEDGRERVLTAAALLDGATAVAHGLKQRGIGRGDTVALMLPTGSAFLETFQGILVAGAVAVPIYPPLRLDRLEEYARRQSAILKDAGVRLLVTLPRAKALARSLRPRVPSLRDVLTTADLATGERVDAPEGGPDDPALIQYTSGSTGHPKGVLLTHANLLSNIRAIARGLDARSTDVGVSWLPLYHDMGLIGSWLFCTHQGLPIDIQSPLSFLSRPERWLWAIHRRRGTLSGAPNFAYELCARRIPATALEGLDLGSWRCALNGAEPVNPDTLERFCRRFEPYGFRREALLPVYGLAECSVALSFPPLGRGPKVDRVRRAAFEADRRADPAAEDDGSALRFVSEGRALPDHEIRVVDEAGVDLPERRVGRVVFRGPSVMRGYYRQPDATQAMSLPGGWLDSGDLGYLAEGELHVTGRLKDVIIKAGRNLVPQEVEAVSADVPGVRRGCIAAFGVTREDTGTETLVVVAETRLTGEPERESLVSRVIEHVAAEIGVPPDVVRLVPPGAVPKTSSGKVRRSAARELYLAGRLEQPADTPRALRLRLLTAALAAEARLLAVRAGRALYGLYLVGVLALVALAVWPILWVVPAGTTVRRLERGVARLILWLAGCRLSSGGASFSASGPLILASNHASYVDVLALRALLPPDFAFVAKREVLSWPLIGRVVRRARHLAVERDEARQSVADAARVTRSVAAGERILVFPEGTFTAVAGLRPFRLGAFRTAAAAGVPVVPLALRGTRVILRDGLLLPRPGKIDLWVGPPLQPTGDGWDAALELRNRVADAIAAHCGEPRLDLVAATRP